MSQACPQAQAHACAAHMHEPREWELFGHLMRGGVCMGTLIGVTHVLGLHRFACLVLRGAPTTPHPGLRGRRVKSPLQGGSQLLSLHQHICYQSMSFLAPVRHILDDRDASCEQTGGV